MCSTSATCSTSLRRSWRAARRWPGRFSTSAGGRKDTISVWAEFAPLLKRLLGREIPVVYGPWRPGDQKVYISDPRKAQRLLGWSPQVSVEQGVSQLLAWLRQQGIGA
jgi:CDP-paratose 2-epimerase